MVLDPHHVRREARRGERHQQRRGPRQVSNSHRDAYSRSETTTWCETGHRVGPRELAKSAGMRATIAASRASICKGLLLLCLLGLDGCISDPPGSCKQQSECQELGKVGICSANGFCERECTRNTDCPCGSFCARSCGLCIQNDGTRPATCFATHQGVDPRTALGACRASKLPARSLGEITVGEADAQVCSPPKELSCEVPEAGDANVPPLADGGHPADASKPDAESQTHLDGGS